MREEECFYLEDNDEDDYDDDDETYNVETGISTTASTDC